MARADVRRLVRGVGVAVLGVLVLGPNLAGAQVDARTSVFYEPSESSQLLVVHPTVSVGVPVSSALSINAGYEADVVSGATEAVKAGPLVDVVTAATSFDDVRHVGRGGFELRRDVARIGASYAYGVESDYRSHAVAVTAGTDLLDRNTQIDLGYAHGFDRVCTTDFSRTLAPSARSALDSSSGCFTNRENRASRSIDLDNFQVGWTQAWTPVFATQMVLTASLAHGFLENPYRSVVIGPVGEQALENHPDDRARAALGLRGKYFLREADTALTLGLRAYRDSWALTSETVELEAEHYLRPWLRGLVRARVYHQSGALFWSDDYTGGEPELGPRGQYWTGDRELSPLWSYLVGGRVLATLRPDGRTLGVFSSFSFGLGVDVSKVDLLEFTWSGTTPDDTLSILGTLTIGGAF